MKKAIIIVVFLPMFLATIHAAKIKKEPTELSCNLQTSKDFTDHQPLVLKQIKGSKEYKFVSLNVPEIPDVLKFDSGENVVLACPGSKFGDTSDTLKTLECVKDKKFRSTINKEENNFNKYQCTNLPESKLIRNGKCAVKKSAFKIGFEVGGVFVKIIDLCFDESTNSALYSMHKILPSVAAGSQKSFERTEFMEGGLFSDISADGSYKRNNQKKIFDDQSNLWVNNHVNDRQFLARGHFSPMGDFVYGVLQAATFYYANVSPQWQSFNNGNWRSLEIAARRLARVSNVELTIYTGTHGIYKLNGKKVYLTNDASKKPTMPVPLFFWKVVYDQENSKVVAFIGLNDPDADPADNPVKGVCTVDCSSIKWTNFKKEPIYGLMYCCAVNELSTLVKTLPPIAKNTSQLSLLDSATAA